MRVISGSARSIPLKTIEGNATRPTTDKIKETLFNMIQFDIPGCRFLDLFAGSGAIAIEALSRGATHATLVDNNPAAIKCINDNLAKTKLDDKAIVINSDSISAIGRIAMTDKKPYNIIFMDPPYNNGLEQRALKAIKGSSVIDDDSIIIIEADIKLDTNLLSSFGFNIVKEKKYKTNKHIFLRRQS